MRVISPEDPKTPLDLIELEQVRFGNLLIRRKNNDVMGENGGVVPVETSFQDQTIVNNAIFGMNR